MNFEEINCEPLTEYDVYQVTKLLRGVQFHIGGARAGFSAIRDLCTLALKEDSPMHIMVAKDARKRIIGVVLGLRDYHRFWLNYYLDHPMIIPSVLTYKFFKTIKKLTYRKRYSAEILEDSDLDIAYKEKSLWSTKDKDIVHILLIIVDNSHRHKSIGRNLYEAFTKYLKVVGIKKVIARIGFANAPSIRLHKKAGWEVYGLKRHIEAIYDFSDSKKDNPK